MRIEFLQFENFHLHERQTSQCDTNATQKSIAGEKWSGESENLLPIYGKVNFVIKYGAPLDQKWLEARTFISAI